MDDGKKIELAIAIQKKQRRLAKITDIIGSLTKEKMDELYEKYRSGEIKFEILEQYVNLENEKAKLEKELLRMEAEARGEKFVKLDKTFYRSDADEVLESLTVKTSIGEKIILKSDSIESIEGFIFHGRDSSQVGSIVSRCDDIEGYTIDFKNIATTRGNRTLHHYGDMECIRHRDSWIEKEYAIQAGLKEDESGYWYSPERGEHPSTETDGLDGYHSFGAGSSNFIEGADDAKYRVGLELEKYNELPDDTMRSMKEKGWRCERDGSVEGGEYITPVLPLDNIENTVNWIIRTGGDALIGDIDSRCGGHIHLSVKGECTALTYERLKNWRPLLWALYPDRVGNRYCSRNESPSQRYADVGLRRETVEIRIFPGCDSERKLRFRLELCKYMLDNKKDSLQDALLTISEDNRLLDILKIAYGSNTIRLAEFFSRAVSYYEIDSAEVNQKVLSISSGIMADKAGYTEEMTREENSILVNV